MDIKKANEKIQLINKELSEIYLFLTEQEKVRRSKMKRQSKILKIRDRLEEMTGTVTDWSK